MAGDFIHLPVSIPPDKDLNNSGGTRPPETTSNGADMAPSRGLLPPSEPPLQLPMLSPLAESVDADDCLSPLPPVAPVDEPDYKTLAMAMRKAWGTPLVQRHLEQSMERDELLQVWRGKGPRSPRCSSNYFLSRCSPRGRRPSPRQCPFPEEKPDSPLSPSKTNGANGPRAPPRSPSGLLGAFSENVGKCFLEFQALGAQLLTTQVLLEEKADSFLSGVRDRALIERTEGMLQRLVSEAESIRDYLRAVFLRWEAKGKELVIDKDETRNGICLKGLKRLVKAAVYAHREMSAFVSFSVKAALKQQAEADIALAEGKRARALRTAAVKRVAVDDVIPFEVYLVFAAPALPLFNPFIQGTRKRLSSSQRDGHYAAATSSTASSSPHKKEAETGGEPVLSRSKASTGTPSDAAGIRVEAAMASMSS